MLWIHLLLIIFANFIVESGADPQPRLSVCGPNLPCACIYGGYLLCSEEDAKIYGPLETANLDIYQENFTAVYVWIESNNIRELKQGEILPKQVANIVEIGFESNEISFIGENAFDGMEKLETLRLSDNKLKKLNRSSFEGSNGMLEYLYLSSNQITELEDGVFDSKTGLRFLYLENNTNLQITRNTFGPSLSKLEYLDLEYCNISKLDDGVFRNLRNLTYLWLRGNPLINVPSAVNELPNLVNLYLSETNISEIQPYSFAMCSQLNYINLENVDNLKTISDCAFCGLKNLEVLYLSHSQITFIDEKWLVGMDKLKNLYLPHNELQKLHKSSFNGLNETLEELDLSYNKITEIEDGAFDPLKKLRRLLLDFNTNIQITKNTFGPSLSELQVLYLSSCNISKLDDEVFRNLFNLTALHLNENPFINIPSAINELPNLYAVDFYQSGISEIQGYAFAKCSKLNSLYLDYLHNLYSIPDCAFCGLTNLKTLIMRGSEHLSEINEGAFGWGHHNETVPSLSHLSLSNASLSSLSPNLLDFTQLVSLEISDNPWNCTCDLAWLIEKHIALDSPSCAAPESLKGRDIKNLTVQELCPNTTTISSTVPTSTTPTVRTTITPTQQASTSATSVRPTETKKATRISPVSLLPFIFVSASVIF